MRSESEPPARWVLAGIPITPGITMGVGAPLYLPTPGTPAWIDPRLFAQDEEEWLALDYRMPTEPLEVIPIVRSLNEVPPVLAPFVRVVGWIVAEEPDPPLPTVPVLWVPDLPRVLPAEPMTILDANAGVAYIQPNAETLARYQSQLLRVATHTRYHLESVHLPVQTWDGQSVEVGAVVAHWHEVPKAIASGADFVMSTARKPPEQVSRVAHALGGKPLWWRLNPDWAFQPEAMSLLWRWSVELNLTLLLEMGQDWEGWWEPMQDEREALRRQHRPFGQITLCQLYRATQPIAEPTALPWRWQALRMPRTLSAATAGRFLRWHDSAIHNGLRRANLMKQCDAEWLAVALAGAPHALVVPYPTLQEAKRLVARLGVSECRRWLLQRLADWENPDLQAQPQRWVQERL